MLEFNMPVHEGWNIVNIAMQVPESYQIFVCPENCARGVVMTAQEMGAGDRIACVKVTEKDLAVDNLETITIEGASEVVDDLATKPKVIFLFTVCSHTMLSCDCDYVFRTLRSRYPDIIWEHAFMDCIRQKEGLMPDEKLRRAMYDFIPKSETDEVIVNLIGSEVTATAENNDIVGFFEHSRNENMHIRQLSDIHTFDDYMKLGNASLNICMYKPGYEGVKRFSDRLGIPCILRLPFYNASTIAGPWYEAFQKEIGPTPVVIDSMAITCPYSLAEYLLDYGFNVQAVVADGPADYEKDIYDSLMKKYPDLTSDLTVRPTDPRLRESSYRNELRNRAIGAAEMILAIGPMAAWIYDTPYFVNQIENDGDFGIRGEKALLEKMKDAYHNPKDLQKIVSRKALGLPSCIV